jgi:hypothetical protein
VAPIVSSSKAPAVYFWFTSLEVGRVQFCGHCEQQHGS